MLRVLCVTAKKLLMRQLKNITCVLRKPGISLVT